VGALLALIAVGVWFGSAVVADRFTTPLDYPFPLVEKERVSVSFIPRLSERHYIGVFFPRDLPFERLQQIVGPLQGEPTARPEITFDLRSRGEIVQTQSAKISWWGSLVGFDLAFFHARAGDTYTLSAEVKAAEADLRRLKARLLIRVHPETGQAFYFRVLFARVFAAAAGVFAVLLFVAAAYVRVRHQRA
jgi:hypothetical protein